MVAACIFSIRVHRTVNEQTEQRFPFERDCCSNLFSSMFLFDQDVVQTVLVTDSVIYVSPFSMVVFAIRLLKKISLSCIDDEMGEHCGHYPLLELEGYSKKD